MDMEKLLRQADFSKNSTAHKKALRNALFKKLNELDMDELENVMAASKAWIEQEQTRLDYHDAADI